MDFDAAHGDPAHVEIDDEVSDCNGARFRFFLRRRRAPERDAYSREELARAERLGDVVVRAGVQCGNLVLLLAASRDDDDRHGALFPDATGDVEAVDVREPEIEEDYVRTSLERLRDA